MFENYLSPSKYNHDFNKIYYDNNTDTLIDHMNTLNVSSILSRNNSVTVSTTPNNTNANNLNANTTASSTSSISTISDHQLGSNNISYKKDLDYPPFSRLFVLYPKSATENELKCVFEAYGPIEDIWIVKEKETGHSKGIAYIKYSKASHAAKAMEELNGKLIANHSKPLKVIISNSKNEKNKNLSNNEPPDSDRMLRLFVVIPKDFRKKDLRDAFKKFGEIENVQIIFNRSTNENKGFGYVRFYKASDAARALEECHPNFKPKFAEPYSVKLAREREMTAAKVLLPNSNGTNGNSSSAKTSMSNINGCDKSSSCNSIMKSDLDFKEKHTSCINGGNNNNNNNGGGSNTNGTSKNSSINANLTKLCPNYSKLIVKCTSTIPHAHLKVLFDLIPGLVDFYCISTSFDTHSLTLKTSNEEIYIVKYENDILASYAIQKLDKFTYPSGEMIHVSVFNSPKYDDLIKEKTILDDVSIFEAMTTSSVHNLLNSTSTADIYLLNHYLSKAL